MLNSAMGIYGGTFDPIHMGHLQVALHIQKACHLNQIRFIPCQQPVLNKSVFASATDRLAMLALALKPYAKNFLIDTREINRATPSYTVLTLESLRQEFPHTPLCLLLGWDAWLSLPRWYQWEKLMDLAHLIIIDRPHDEAINSATLEEKIQALPKTLQDYWQKKHTDDPQKLHTQLAGFIYFYNKIHIPISATSIRQNIALGTENQIKSYLPEGVLEYIQKHELYKPHSLPK